MAVRRGAARCPGTAGRDGVIVDEGALDATLLALLDPDPDAFAEVFVERSCRVVRAVTVLRDDERPTAPASRDDRGVALRLADGDRVRATHVSGEPDERLGALARGLARGPGSTDRDAEPRSAAEGGASGDARPAGSSDPERTALVLDALRAAARRAMDADASLRAIDVQVVATRRAVHVASSEWGHVSATRTWTTAALVAEVATPAGSRRARASRGQGGPALAADLRAQDLVDEVVAAAHRRLDARPIAPGRPVLVVARGAGGILVHEAVGHALEGDVVARGSSFLSGRLGERVGVEGLTVLDDPSLPGLAGSAPHDDEGAPSRATTLIEAGVLRGVLLDGARCGFRKALATGHGRRSGFRDQPLPRMANTCIAAGRHDPAEIVAGVADGLLVTRLERASVDPACGGFQLRGTEGWRIEGGRLTAPLQDVLIVGSADRLLGGIDAVGSDLAWDAGAGTCGREGQWVPVSVGQPTLRLAAGVFGVA